MPARLPARAAIAIFALILMFAASSAAPVHAAGGPAASAGGPYVAVEGALIIFSSTITDEGAGGPHVYEWDFDYDGTTFVAGQSATSLTSPVHTYPDDAVTQVAVRVTDSLGTTGPVTTADVTVQNSPPVAFAGGPYEVDTGASLLFHGAAFDAGEDSLTYEWDFEFAGGAFSVDASGAGLSDPAHTYTSAGSKVVALRVRDDDGGLSGVALASVQVAAVGPVADAGGPYTTTNGLAITTERAVTFSGSATQAGAGDLTFEWEFDHNGCDFVPDLSGVGLADPVHLYLVRGGYMVALRVTDADGAEGAVTTALVTVANDSGLLPPTADAGGPYVATEGGSVGVVGSATGSPLGAGFDFAWDLNNQCSFDKSGPGVTFSAAGLDGPDEREITLRVTDPVDGAVSTSGATVSILNAPPVVSPLNLPSLVISGSDNPISASATDPGVLDTLTFLWDFNGDGFFDASGSEVNFSKKVNTRTEFTVTVRVTDDDGASDEESGIITVRLQPQGVVVTTATPTASPSPTPAVIAEVTPEASLTPAPEATAKPVSAPTATPVPPPMVVPSPVPAPTPTAMPSSVPVAPTATPVAAPAPTPSPTSTAGPPLLTPTATIDASAAIPAATATRVPADTVTPEPNATAVPLAKIPEPPALPPVEIEAVLIEARSEQDVLAVSESGNLAVRIPAGALPDAAELFVVSTSPQTTLARGPNGERVAGAAIEVGTGVPGVEFAGAIEISVAVDQMLLEAAAGDLKAITFWQLDAQTGLWREVQSRVEGNQLIVNIEGPGRLVPTVPGPPPRPGEAIVILTPGEERLLAPPGEGGSAAVVVVVPPGAVKHPVSLVYVPRRLSGTPPPNDGESLVGVPFELTAFRLDEEQEGFEFEQPVQVFVSLTPEQLNLAELGLALTFFDTDTGRWEPVLTTPVEGGLRADLRHLSLFAVSVDAEIEIAPDVTGATAGGPASVYLVSPFDGGAPARAGGLVTATLMLDPGGAAITGLDIRLVGSSGVLEIGDFAGVGLCEGAGSPDGQGGARLDCTLSEAGYSGQPIAIGEVILTAAGVGSGSISITADSVAIGADGTDLIGLLGGLSLNIEAALTVESVIELIGGRSASIWRWLAPAIAAPALLILFVLTYVNRSRIGRISAPLPRLKLPRRRDLADRVAIRRRRERPPVPPASRKVVTAGGLVMLAVIVGVAVEHRRRKKRPPARAEFSWREWLREGRIRRRKRRV